MTTIPPDRVRADGRYLRGGYSIRVTSDKTRYSNRDSTEKLMI